jgi:hypothetical protein
MPRKQEVIPWNLDKYIMIISSLFFIFPMLAAIFRGNYAASFLSIIAGFVATTHHSIQTIHGVPALIEQTYQRKRFTAYAYYLFFNLGEMLLVCLLYMYDYTFILITVFLCIVTLSLYTIYIASLSIVQKRIAYCIVESVRHVYVYIFATLLILSFP